MAKREKKKKLPLSGAKRYSHRSHMGFKRFLKNKHYQDWLDRHLEYLRKKYIKQEGDK